jgi:hypothetical protein
MNRKNPSLARKKRAFLFVQSEKLSIQRKNQTFGIFPKATIYTKTALLKEAPF